MPSKTYTIPGISLDLQDGGLQISRNESANVLIVGPTAIDDTVDNVCHYEPSIISSKASFTTDGYIGSYKVSNPIARAFKQINSISGQSVAALPLPSNATIRNTESEDKLEKRIRAYMYLHNAFASLRYNSTYDAIVLKNMYTNTYNFEVLPVDIGYFNSVYQSAPVKKYTVNVSLYGKWICLTPDTFTNLETTGASKIEFIEAEIGEEDKILAPYSFVKIARDGVIEKVIEPTINEDAFDSTYLGETLTGAKTNEDVEDENKLHKFDISTLLAGFCQITSVTNRQILGFISTEPCSGTDIVTIKTWVEGLDEVKLNGYVQVTATPACGFAMDGEAYPDSIEAAYCATVLSLSTKSSTTNKPIGGLTNMFGLLSSSQCASLAIKNYVTLRKKANLFVVSDGVTSAGADSDFARLTTVRITNKVINNIKDIGDPYIGEPNTTATRNALQAQIKEMLAQMQADGEITSFLDPELIATTEDIINGDLKIMIAFFPTFEIRRINLVVALRQLA